MKGLPKSLVIADVGSKPKQLKIVADGKEIVAPKTKEAYVKDLLVHYVPTPKKTVPKVIDQNPRPGTLVAPGTVVDITLVTTDDVTMNAFELVLPLVQNWTLTQMMEAIDLPDVLEVLDASSEPGDVDEGGKETLKGALAQAGADDVPDDEFELLWHSAQNARPFLL